MRIRKWIVLHNDDCPVDAGRMYVLPKYVLSLPTNISKPASAKTPPKKPSTSVELPELKATLQ